MREAVDEIYRTESRRVFATLVRLLGDFDLAEEALHEAFRAALEQWPRDGVPANPRAWLVSAGRFKAIDRIRREQRFDAARRRASLEIGAGARKRRTSERDRGRPPAPHLHLLPPGARPRRAGRAHAARGLRADDRGDRARLPHARADARAAHRAREGQDPRRAHPVRGARAAASCRSGSTRCCA